MRWITLDCELGNHPKMAALPSDSARYGWVLTLLEAKKQRQAGTFASAQHFRIVLGQHGKFLAAYLAAGLLEADGDRLLVHDWSDYQRNIDRTAAERAANYRERHAGDRDASRVASRDTSRPRARAGAVPPLNVDVTGRDTGGDLDGGQPEDAALSYLSSVGATVMPDGNGYHRELVRFVGRQGSEVVIAALRARYEAGDRSARQLIYGAMNDVERIHRPGGAKPKGHQGNKEAIERAFGS